MGGATFEGLTNLQFSYLNTISENVQTKLNSLNTSVIGNSNSISSLNTSITTNSNSISSLNTTVNNHTNSINTINSNIITLETDITTNNNAIAQSLLLINSNTSNITTNTNNITTLTSTVNTFTDAIQANTDKLDRFILQGFTINSFVPNQLYTVQNISSTLYPYPRNVQFFWYGGETTVVYLYNVTSQIFYTWEKQNNSSGSYDKIYYRSDGDLKILNPGGTFTNQNSGYIYTSIYG